MGSVDAYSLILGPAFVEQVTGPEWVGIMGDRGRCGEIGLAPLLVHGHAGGHLPELLEVLDPEVLIHVQIAVVTLGSPHIGAEKIEGGAIGQHQRIASKLNPTGVLDELDDVLPENMGLGLGGTEEDLVLARVERIHDGFPGKVPGCTDLP